MSNFLTKVDFLYEKLNLHFKAKPEALEHKGRKSIITFESRFVYQKKNYKKN